MSSARNAHGAYESREAPKTDGWKDDRAHLIRSEQVPEHRHDKNFTGNDNASRLENPERRPIEARTRNSLAKFESPGKIIFP